MMAFHTIFDDMGRKQFLPSPALKDLLKQDRIMEKDVRCFRSSNRVNRLIDRVFEQHGFAWVSGCWMRKKADAPALQTEKYKSILPPKPGITLSVASKISAAVYSYMKSYGHTPNTLFICPLDLQTLQQENYGFGSGLHYGCTWQGMVIIQSSGGITVAHASQAPPMSKQFSPYQTEKFNKLFGSAILPITEFKKAVHVLASKQGDAQRAPLQKKVVKRIVPHSQLKRKLALEEK
jgi:hypothetical protein